jgi:LacI family transcriptional regulator
MVSHSKVALVFACYIDQDARILHAISHYNRLNRRWSAFIDDQAFSKTTPDYILNRNWDGIISKEPAPELFAQCLKRGIPCVDLSDYPAQVPGIPKIHPDNRAVGHMAAEYFIEKGYHNFAFCGFSNKPWSEDRKTGYIEALDLVNRKPLIFESEHPEFTEADWDKRIVHEITEWIESIPKPLAVFSANDLRGLQIIDACSKLKAHVPEEVSVLGVNNDTLRCELSNPQLSSISLNCDSYGQTAAKLLDQLMNGDHVEETDILIEPRGVVTRRSTDAFCIEDSNVAAALHLIKNKAHEGITVDWVVSQLKTSRSSLERNFRKYLGKTPQAEIRDVQIQKIKQLLLETNYTLAHIASLTGFEHPEYMAVVFKKASGQTLNKYRQKYRIEK